MRKQWEEEEKKKKKEDNKYNIDPSDNVPQKVYGVPNYDFSQDKNENKEKYDINPEDNVPREVYGIPSPIKKELSKAIDLDLKSLNKKIDEANNYILQHNYEPAKKILNEYLDAALNAYKEDQITRYFTFKDVIEFYCSKEKLNIQKKLVWIDLRTDDAYKLLAYIASEEKNFSQAIDY